MQQVNRNCISLTGSAVIQSPSGPPSASAERSCLQYALPSEHAFQHDGGLMDGSRMLLGGLRA